MAKRFPAGWPTTRGPLLISAKVDGQTREFEDVGPIPARLYCRHEADFLGGPDIIELDIPMFSTTDNVAIVPDQSDNARGYGMVPRAGVLIGAQFLGEDSLAVSDSNFVTFYLQNLGDGTADVDMLEETEANGTTTDGAAITGLVPFDLTIHAEETGEPLRVAAGDVLMALATVDGVLANAIEVPIMRVRIQTVPYASCLVPLAPRATGTDVSCLVAVVEDDANGVVKVMLGENDTSTIAGLTANDQLLIPGNKGPILQWYGSVGELESGDRVVIGLASGHNATLDSVTYHAWFRLEGSLAVLVEGDDGTTDTDDRATGFTLTADQEYLFTVNMSDPSQVMFWIDDSHVGTVALTAISTNVLQPLMLVQKDEGNVTTPYFLCDRYDLMWRRK